MSKGKFSPIFNLKIQKIFERSDWSKINQSETCTFTKIISKINQPN